MPKRQSSKPLGRLYKIRRKSDGLFATGRSRRLYNRGKSKVEQVFNAGGKTWTQESHLKLHIRDKGYDASEVEVVVYEVVEAQVVSIAPLLEDQKKRDTKKRLDGVRRALEYKRSQYDQWMKGESEVVRRLEEELRRLEAELSATERE